MTHEEFEHIRTWFHDYVDLFSNGNEQSVHMIQMKLKHSRNVAENCRTLAEELQWPEQEVIAAEALGLLHDIGRFSQYAEYGTFVDFISLDHGKRGYEVISGSPVLSFIDSRFHQRILDGIRYHSCRDIPEGIPEENMPLLKIVRDADKLDILHLIDNSIKNNNHIEHLNMALHLSSDGPINQKAIDEILNRNVVSHKNIKSRMDFHLMQLSWVFDINYNVTYKRILDSQIYDSIINKLSVYKEIHTAIECVLSYLKTRASVS